MIKKLLPKIVTTFIIFLFSFSYVNAAVAGPAPILDPNNNSDLEITELLPTSDIFTTGENRTITVKVKNIGVSSALNFSLSVNQYKYSGELMLVNTSSCTSSDTSSTFTKTTESNYSIDKLNVGSFLTCSFMVTLNSTTNNETEIGFSVNKKLPFISGDLSYDNNNINDTLYIRKFKIKPNKDFEVVYDKASYEIVNGMSEYIKVTVTNKSPDTNEYYYWQSTYMPSESADLKVELIYCDSLMNNTGGGCYSNGTGSYIDLDYNQSVIITYKVTSQTTAAKSIPFKINLTAINYTESNLSNQNPVNITTIQPRTTNSADLSVTISDNKMTYIAGTNTTNNTSSKYNITITNNSTSDLVDAKLIIPKPNDAYKIDRISPLDYPNMKCFIVSWTNSPTGCNELHTETNYIFLFSVKANSSFVVEMYTSFDYDSLGNIEVPVSVELPQGITDTNISNNSSSDINSFGSKLSETENIQFDAIMNSSISKSELSVGDEFEVLLTFPPFINTRFLSGLSGYLNGVLPKGIQLTSVDCTPKSSPTDSSSSTNTSICRINEILTLPNNPGENIIDIKELYYGSLVGSNFDLFSNGSISYTLKLKVLDDFIPTKFKIMSYFFSIDFFTQHDYNNANNTAEFELKLKSTCTTKGNSDNYCDLDLDGKANIDDTDDDGDGQSDVDEAVWGDRDGNGTNDSLEKNIMSINNTSNANTLTSVIPSNCTYNSLINLQNESDITTQDTSFDYPQGIAKVKLNCSKAENITLYFDNPSNLDATKLKFRKYGNKTPGNSATLGWYDFPAVITNVTISNKKLIKVVYSLEDGKLGDNTGVDGIIEDPVGIAQGVLANTGNSSIINLGLGIMVLILCVSLYKINLMKF